MAASIDIETLAEDEIAVLLEESIATMAESGGSTPTTGTFAPVAGLVTCSGAVAGMIAP